MQKNEVFVCRQTVAGMKRNSKENQLIFYVIIAEVWGIYRLKHARGKMNVIRLVRSVHAGNDQELCNIKKHLHGFFCKKKRLRHKRLLFCIYVLQFINVFIIINL